MTLKQLVKLIILFAVLAILATVVWLSRSKSGSGDTSVKGEGDATKVFPALDVNTVSGMRIVGDDSSSEILRKEGEWVVASRENYPANYDEIRKAVMELRGLKKVQSLSPPEDQLKRFGLSDDSEEKPVKVELLKDDGSVITSLLLGGEKQGSGSGRYVKVADEQTVHFVNQELRGFKATSSDWLAKDFFKVQKIQSVKIHNSKPEDSFEVSRPDAAAEFLLADGNPEELADDAKTSGFKWMLGSPTFDDVVSAEDAKKINFGMGSTTAEISTFDGFRYVLNIAKVEKSSGAEASPTPAPPEFDYYLKVGVTAQLAEKRTPGPEEKPEESAALDEAWATEQAGLKEKLAQEQKLSGRVFQIAEYTVTSLLKTRGDIIKLPEPAVPAAGGAPGGAIPGAPGGGIPGAPGGALPPGFVPPGGGAIPVAPSPAPVE